MTDVMRQLAAIFGPKKPTQRTSEVTPAPRQPRPRPAVPRQTTAGGNASERRRTA